jgi:hypothetical protein
VNRLFQFGSVLRTGVLASLALFAASAPARADLTIFLEEPYALDGEIAGTGHTAIYLSNVCADSPTVLRRCEPGETGVVLSRYHRIAGYDWLAMPLLPYLYAVERPEDIPLIADPKIEAAMRDAYRRKYLQGLAPDGPEGQTPKGDWYELVGSAFDRALYGFQLATSTEQDDAFIARYNARPNRQAYKLVTSNCADFVLDVVNFYYPKAATRSFFADLDVATPKHVAKSVAHYAHRHPEVAFTAYVIPQIPGSIKRSTPVHGVVDTVFKAKKYEIPLLVFHPFVGGGFAVAYAVSGRFNPARGAQMYSPDGSLEPPLTTSQRRAYAKSLEQMLREEDSLVAGQHNSAAWRTVQTKAVFAPDAAGYPALSLPLAENAVVGDSVPVDAQVFAGTTPAVAPSASQPTMMVIGLTRENILTSTAPTALTRDLLVTRLRQELSAGTSPHTSERQFRADLSLLEKLFAVQNQTIAAAGGFAPSTDR